MKLIDSPKLMQLVAGGDPESSSPNYISIFLPTHRAHPESAQDPIRFKNLAGEALKRVADSSSTIDEKVLKQQFDMIVEDHTFWKHRTEGLAVFYSVEDPEELLVLELQRPVPERVIVANSFHIKPLIRILQTSDRYHVLALSRGSAKLYIGNRDALDEVESANIPSEAEDVLDSDRKEAELRAESYGGRSNAMFHGHGSKKDEVNKDRDKYFRAVADEVEKSHSNPTKLPLVLVALDEYHAPFRAVTKNNFLVADGVRKDPSSMELSEIQKSSWEILKSHFDERLKNDIERFGTSKANRQGSSILSDVIQEANNGRVELLLLDESRKLVGDIDWVTGKVRNATDMSSSAQNGSRGSNGVSADGDDVFDDIAEMVLSRGGSVRVVAKDSLNTDSGVAAIYRY